MPIYRFVEPRLDRVRVREWRRQAMRTVVLLLLALLGCMGGLILLDPSADPLPEKASVALWNAGNLIPTPGEFTASTRVRDVRASDVGTRRASRCA